MMAKNTSKISRKLTARILSKAFRGNWFPKIQMMNQRINLFNESGFHEK